MIVRQIITRYIAALLSVAILQNATADVLEITDKELWIDLVGEFTTIDFTGLKDGTFITDQYTDFGVLFMDGDDNIFVNEGFLNDGAGLDGNQSIDLVFDSPQTYISVDHPGFVKFELFSNGELLYMSNELGHSGLGFFAGLISSLQFDEVILTGGFGPQVFIDDLHFGYLPPGDIDHDGVVGTADLLILLGVWGDVCADPCPGDINSDDETDIEDLLALLEAWGLCDDCDLPENCPADIDNNCIVGASDLITLLNNWGDCPDLVFIPCLGEITFDGEVNTSDLLLLLDNWSE